VLKIREKYGITEKSRLQLSKISAGD
jgi:hypothetical protein